MRREEKMKKKSWNKKGLVVLISIFLCICFSGCMGGMGISVRKLDYEPEDYINITTEQLEEYPTMKECVIFLINNYERTVQSMDCSQSEINKIEILFGEDPNDNVVKGENFFKYQNEFYSLGYVAYD